MNRIYKPLFNAITAIASLLISLSAQANFTLPEYQQITLENGLAIYLMEQHEVPLIDVKLVVKVGSIHDGAKPGLNNMTLANMELATAQQTKADIEQALDFIGAELYTDGDTELSSATASFAAKDQAKVLGIMRDIMISPRFDQNEFNKYKQRYLQQLRQQKESPREVIGTYFNKMIYGEQGYGSPVQGDADSIAAITLDDLKAFHSQWYRPQNSAVIIAGDFDSKTLLIRLKALFSGWKKTKTPRFTESLEMQPFSQSNVLLVNKSDSRETRFLIGGKGIQRANPDYVAVSVINTVLGGRFTSWLNDALRVNAGLTYGARSNFDAFNKSGTFAISTFTKTETTVEAIDLALKTYRQLFDQGIDEKTLASAKTYVKGQFPPKYETSAQLVDLMAAMFGYGLGKDYINTFEQQVDSLNEEKVKQLIAKYFPKDNLQFLLIGKADAIKEQVAKYGKLKQIDIKDVGF